MRALVLGLLLFVILFIGGFLALGEFVYDYSFSVHRFPIIIGGVTIALALGVIVRVLAAPRPAAAGISEARDGAAAEAEAEGAAAPAWPKGTTAALLWLAAALPAMILLGYVAGTAIYLLAYLRLHGERWLTATAFATVGALVVYFGFHEFLGVRLPVYPFWWPA